MSTLDIFGIPIEVGNRFHLFEKCTSLVGIGGIICTPNPLILSRSVENVSLREALLAADLCIPDGKGLLPYLRRKDRGADVLPGVELGEWLLRARGSLCIGFYGGREGIAARAFSYLSGISEDLRAAFFLNGYDTPLSSLLAALKETKPDLVFVCLGAPKQEIVMHSLRAFAPRTLFLGLGGSLDVYAGAVRRAPYPLRALRLEWLYRMCREPRRFCDLPELLRFPVLYRQYVKKITNLQKNV